jgi:hypothetical protein
MLEFLVQRAEQMEGFHAANFRLALAQFCDFFDQDDVIALVEESLRRRQVINPKGWYDDSVKQSTPLPLPEGGAHAMAARYALMKQVRLEKVDLRFVTTNVFPGSHLNETLMNWKRLVVHPFVADLRTLSRDVRARLGDGEWVDLLAILADYLDGDFEQVAFGPRAWTDADDERAEAEGEVGDTAGSSSEAETASESETEHDLDPETRAIPPTAKPSTGSAPGPALPEVVAALREAAESVGSHDLLLDVTALGLELSRTPWAVARIHARLDRLSDHAPLRDACAALRRLV